MIQEKTDLADVFKNLSHRRRTPVSTYRLQFHQGFGFKEARNLLPYLAALGISDCYASPILKARPGSLHGYDICDHNALNPELGTEADFENFTRDLKTLHMGLILDFVPNHMGIDPETNPWWHDVLENGRHSQYADYFDIYWDPIYAELKGKVLLPILGDQYGVTLEKGDIQLEFNGRSFSIRYFEHRLPVDPRQYSRVLRWDFETLRTELSNDATLRDYFTIQAALERGHETRVALDRLARLVQSDGRLSAHIARAVKAFNGQPGQHRTFDSLHALLEAQAYRLAYWKTASHEINYRRFFDINGLAGLRIENPQVFSQVHRLVMRLIVDGAVTGLRIDHPDGLYDPALYFESLQNLFLQEWVKQATNTDTPEQTEMVRDWRVSERKKDPKGLAARPLYIVAEKILSQRESLDPHWMIDGSSGYDFLNTVNGLFIDGRQRSALHELYASFSGRHAPFESTRYTSKKLIMSTSLASELNVLAYNLHALAQKDRRTRDFTLDGLREALKEVLACFPVYRTYISPSRAGESDRLIIGSAIADAKRRNASTEHSVLDYLYSVLTPENVETVASDVFKRQLGFTMKFQQYSAPVQAKGLEDTAFYRDNALISLNEVGGDPVRFGTSVEEFHAHHQERQQKWPLAMLATSTHDTKRGEDARARLNVLSEIPQEWGQVLSQWVELNKNARTLVEFRPAPDRNIEYLFYQSLLGAWSEDNFRDRALFISRMREYLLKAIREAKQHTSWTAPNDAYEKAVATFVETVLAAGRHNAFLAAFTPFARRLSFWGLMNSLSQLVLKIASPGVPDFYQGTELWDLHLVDPDNRQPVDFERRRKLLRQIRPLLDDAARLPETLQHWEDGRIKMFIMASGLKLRRRYPALFLEGAYLPLEVVGSQKDHVVAFARVYGEKTVLAVVPRRVATLVPNAKEFPTGTKVWENTFLKLPKSLDTPNVRSLFTQEDISVKDGRLFLSKLLSVCPVGLFF